ncbi:hypothetical protein Dimus_038457 [Dionaea muscipula]
MGLTNQLARANQGSQSIADYLGHIRGLADELALIGSSIADPHLILYVLNGLGTEYREISTAVRARDNMISFEELHDKLIEYEAFLKQHDPHNQGLPSIHHTRHNPKNNNTYTKRTGQSNNGAPPILGAAPPHNFQNSGTTKDVINNSPSPIICQFCDKKGHTAKDCFKAKRLMGFPVPPRTYHTTTNVTQFSPSSSSWLLDTGATHHVTADLNNLSLHQPYDGPDDLTPSNETGLSISHSGHSTLSSVKKSFHLGNILCVPKINQNLISVSQFYIHNNTSIEFTPTHFFIKDLFTGSILLQGESRNNVYQWPRCQDVIPGNKQVHVSLRTTMDRWHERLGHPSIPILRLLVSNKHIDSSST